MNTFVPYENFRKSAQCLDSRRLRKQQVECKLILDTIFGKIDGWKHHPAVLMWVSNENALIEYAAEIATECAERDYSVNSYMASQEYYDHAKELTNPWWVGTFDVHYAYQSKLLFKGRKDVLERRIRDYMARPDTISNCRSVGAWLRQSGWRQMNQLDHKAVATLEGLMDKHGVPKYENHYTQYFKGVPDDLPYFWPGPLEREELYAAP